MTNVTMARVVASALMCALGSASQAGEWSVSATPRFSIGFLSVAGGEADGSPLALSAETSTLAIGGFSVGISNSDWSGTELIGTVQYGEGGRDIDITATTPAGLVRASAEGDDELLDLELLVRRPLGRTGAYWTAGVQYRDVTSDVRITSGPPVFNGRDEIDVSTSFLLVKVGLGTVFPLRETERHRLFGNVLLGAGPTEIDIGSESDSGSIVGIDVNMGWQYLAKDNLSIALRYRVQLGRSYSQELLPNDWSALHGPELNVSYRF